MVTKDQVIKALSSVKDPDTGKDALLYGLIKSINIHPDGVHILVSLSNPSPERIQKITRDLQTALSSIPDVGTVKVDVTPKVEVQPVLSKEPMIKNVIAVASGKGGVGKSTVAVNLAFIIAKMGYKVGLLDADIYGASAHLMLGQGEPPLVQNNRIVPAMQHGVKFVSMGFFSRSDTPVIWRGPLVGKAVRDFVEITDWGELDYLIVDLPPGCLASGTMVLMADNSEKPIEKIEAGEYVLSYDGHNFVPSRVLGVFEQGRRKVYEVRTENRSILATENHPFLTSARALVWQSLGALKLGDKILVHSDCTLEYDAEAAKDNRSRIRPFNAESVKKVGFLIRSYLQENGRKEHEQAILKSLSSMKRSLSRNRLPRWVFSLPAEYKVILLESCGETGSRMAKYANTSLGEQAIVLMLEDKVTIRSRNKILIEELHKLSQTAGVEVSDLQVCIQFAGQSQQDQEYEFYFSKPSYQLKSEEITSIRQIGEVETYDLQVEHYHNFVANGFVVHNTGDAPLTLAQTLKLSGIVLVTTPQEAAVQVAMKAYYMFKKLDIPIIGVIENMSYFVCPRCGEKTKIFGQGGGKRIAERLGVPFIGEIPLYQEISESGDTGSPLYNGRSEAASTMHKIAETIIKLVDQASSQSQ
ncbi:MAG: P-loop NTPase [Nitrososphaerota archaeon]